MRNLGNDHIQLAEVSSAHKTILIKLNYLTVVKAIFVHYFFLLKLEKVTCA